MSSLLPAIGLFLVGASAVDITPKLCEPKGSTHGCLSNVYLAGFGPYFPLSSKNRKAEGVHDPLWARSLAVQGADGRTLLIMSVDSAGLAWKHINPVRRKIAQNFGIPVERIVIAATHAHSTPDGTGYWSTFLWNHGKEYTDLLRQKMYESARDALLSMRPARMKSAETRHFACYNPKTLELKKDPDCNLPLSDPEQDAPGADFDEVLIQNDLRDPWIRNTTIVAAQFESLESGKTIATFVNWNDHPETAESANHLISSDYSNYLRNYMERALGGISVYFIGTLGSQIGALRGTPVPLWSESFERQYSGELDIQGRPVPVLVRNGWDKVRSIGYEIGSEAVRALEATPWPDAYDPPVWIETRSIDIRVDNAIHFLTGPVWNFDVQKKDQMQHYLPRCGLPWGCVRSDLSILQIGDIGIATAPGEIDPAYLLGRPQVVADYGGKWGKWTFPAMPALAPYLPGKHHIMFGQAGNYLSYLVHKADNVGWWNGEHPNVYEEQVTVGKDFGDDVGNQLMEMLGSKERY